MEQKISDGQQKPKLCVLCRRQITGPDHNAYPVTEGRCCSECNDTRVVPTRERLDKAWSSS